MSHTRKSLGNWALAAAITGAALAGPTAAHAASVSVVGGQLVYEAAPGEVNTVVLETEHPVSPTGEPTSTGVFLSQAGTIPLAVGTGCWAVPGGAGCDVAFESVAILRLGDRNDSASDNRYPVTSGVDIYGGAGNDTMSASMVDGGNPRFDGGGGNDTIFSGGANAVITGGTGDDKISTGEAGPNISIDAGDGNDTVTYDMYYEVGTGPVKLGAGDDKLTLTQNVFSYAQSRVTPYGTFNGSALPESAIDGGAGKDTVVLGAGGGAIFDLSAAQTNLEIVDATASTPFTGEDGKDVFYGNLLIGSDGYEVFRGGSGPDVIIPGRRADWVAAGPGSDRIIANDGAIDHISCGTGTDYVRIDRTDDLFRRDCEKSYGALPPVPTTPAR